MAKLYGSLVGTPLQSATTVLVNNFCSNGLDTILRRDTVAFANTNVIGDQVSFGVFKSGCFLSPTCALFFDAFGASCKLSIGDATYPTGLSSLIDVSAVSAPSVPFIKSFTAAKMAQPLWQLLGYAADPKAPIELLGTIASANVSNAANLAWQLIGINR